MQRWSLGVDGTLETSTPDLKPDTRNLAPFPTNVAAAGKLVIYTDANCRFCRWARDAVEPYDDLKPS